MISLTKTTSQKWFGLSSCTIKTLAENQGRIGFLMGFKNDKGGEPMRIICHFEEWPGLSNLPTCFSQEVKGVMFFPFVPQNPIVEFVPLQKHVKVPYVYAKTWELLPKYQAIAFPCYVLWDHHRLVFGMSPHGPFFAINLDGKSALLQRKFFKKSEMDEDGKIPYTTDSLGIPQFYKLGTFNVNVYED